MTIENVLKLRDQVKIKTHQNIKELWLTPELYSDLTKEFNQHTRRVTGLGFNYMEIMGIKIYMYMNVCIILEDGTQIHRR